MATLPLTDTSSSNSALPVILDVPPIETLPTIAALPDTQTAPSNSALPPTVNVPPTDALPANCAS